jgi:uncharacterized membrane protein
MQTEWWAIAMTAISVAIGSFGPIWLKKGADGLSLNLKALLKNKHLFGGVLCYAIGTVLYIIALRGGELSVLYPIISISYPIVAFLSVIMLKEHMNKWKLAGTVFIIAGIILLSFA